VVRAVTEAVVGVELSSCGPTAESAGVLETADYSGGQLTLRRYVLAAGRWTLHHIFTLSRPGTDALTDVVDRMPKEPRENKG
jgi:hypothetical protein